MQKQTTLYTNNVQENLKILICKAIPQNQIC